MRRLFRPLLVLYLFAVTLTVAAQTTPIVRFTIERFVVEGENPLSAEETDSILSPYTGTHEGLEGLAAAASELEGRLHREGFAFHRVSLPQQTLAERTVILRVVRFPVSRVDVEGNDHFSDANVRAAVPELEPGKSPNTKRLSRQLLLANEHPSRRVDLRFRAGLESDGLAAVLAVEDRPPDSWFVNFNNTGTPETDYTRATVGYQHSNLFDRDHMLTATYTSSPRARNKVFQIGLNYRIPFYELGGALSLFWADSDVTSGQAAGFDVKGAGRFWGVRYQHHLAQFAGVRHSVTVSIEDKKFIDATTPVVPPVGVDVRSRPLIARYDISNEFQGGRVRAYAAYVWNLARGRNNDKTTYALRRAGASSSWDAVRLGVGFTRQLPRSYMVIGRFDTQLANEPLVSGEQFGAGGARSVRGYDERIVAGDAGFTASLEAWAPPFDNGLRMLAFTDMGKVENKNPQAGERRTTTLSSVGIGARWTWRKSLSLDVDWAKVLSTAGSDSEDRTKLHFNLLYRF